jgi:hypothetical protein
MPRLRKSKAHISTPTPPAELTRGLTTRDTRVLTTSSTAVARTHDTSNGGAAVRGGNTGWQTAYSAARMAVEITKESSDMFPPLKAVVGAVSFLIKNYDVGVSRSQTKRLLILSPFPTPANIG